MIVKKIDNVLLPDKQNRDSYDGSGSHNVLFFIVNDFSSNCDVEDGHHSQHSNDIFVLFVVE